jgi:Sulfotransferase family
MVKTPVRQPLFIVGMYKSGTSWLLRILDQHPRLRGVKEIDLIGAGSGKVINGDTLLTRKERLTSYFSANAWAALPKDLTGNIQATSILVKQTGSESISSIFELPTEKAIDTILKLYDLKLKQGKSDWAPNEKRQLLSIVDVPRASLIDLYIRIADAGSIYEAGDAFLATMNSIVNCGSSLVLKGADLIARYGYLQKWKSNSKKILIVRDGRDVAISAMYYRRLMRSVKRAHVNDGEDYWNLLNAWRNRVNILMDMTPDKNLVILRYEDLMLNFKNIVAALFVWLGLAYVDTTLDEIYMATSFETLTDRKPGESAQHLLRRGMIGEWKEVLSQSDSQKAWHEAGRELTFLGYTESGSYEPLNIAGALQT